MTVFKIIKKKILNFGKRNMMKSKKYMRIRFKILNNQIKIKCLNYNRFTKIKFMTFNITMKIKSKKD